MDRHLLLVASCWPPEPNVCEIAAIIGLILVIGSILMLLGFGTIGSIVVFPLAVLSLLIGGGFVAGFVWACWAEYSACSDARAKKENSRFFVSFRFLGVGFVLCEHREAC